MYPVEAFYEAIPDIQIIVVISEEMINPWKELCKNYHLTIPHKLAIGGPERFHSVKSGLAFVDQEGVVAVHDAARPLVSSHIIKNTFHLAAIHGAVIPVVEINDSVRKTDGFWHAPIERKNIRLVQTPQVFKTSIIKSAYLQQYDFRFTDDATVVEAAGINVLLTQGENDNIKITRPSDLLIAEALIKSKNIHK